MDKISQLSRIIRHSCRPFRSPKWLAFHSGSFSVSCLQTSNIRGRFFSTDCSNNVVFQRIWRPSRALVKIFIGSICLLLSFSAYADFRNSLGGILDFNYYPYLSDVDSDSNTTINASSSLGQRFSYFSLTNLSNDSGSRALQDINKFYTEQNIRWQVAENSPLDLTLQMNFRSGGNNDRHRLGVRWRLNHTEILADFFQHINLSYSINLHAVQFDNEDAYVWQLEHVFFLRVPSISEKLYLAGFVDHTFNQDLPSNFPDNPIVAEFQLGYRIFDNFHAITEYRINEYRRNDVSNLSAGLQYKINW